MSFFLISQVLAGIGLCSDIVSFQFKDRKHILICFVVSTLLLSIHYLLLGSFLSGIIVFLSFLRVIIAYFRIDRIFIYLFSVITIGVFMWLKDYSFSGFLALFAGIFFSIAAFQKTDKWLRVNTMIGTAFWIPHVVFVGTPMGLLVEILFLMSNVIGYYRYYIRKH